MAEARIPSPESVREAAKPQPNVPVGVGSPEKPKIQAQLRKNEPEKKASLLKMFFAGSIDDMVKNTEKSIKEQLIPGAEKALIDMVYNAVCMLVFNKVKPPQGGAPVTNRTNYTSFSHPNGQNAPSYAYTGQRTSRTNTNAIVFNTRDEAETVKENIYAILEQDGRVSVATFCDQASVDHNHTDCEWGWLRFEVDIPVLPTQENDGFWLKMPRPVPLPGRNRY